MAVERERGVAAGVVLAADEAFNTRDEGSDLGRIGGRRVVGVWKAVTAPRRAAIVGVIRARVTVAECATRRPINKARPCARDVVVRTANDSVWVVRVNRDRRFILRRGRGVLIHQDVWRENLGAVERTGQDERRSDRGCQRRNDVWLLCLLLKECGEAHLQAGSSPQRGYLAGECVDVVLRRSGTRWAGRD